MQPEETNVRLVDPHKTSLQSDDDFVIDIRWTCSLGPAWGQAKRPSLRL